MLNYENFAVTLGRTVDVFRTAPGDVVRQKGALRALVALSGLGAVAMRVEDDQLYIGGKPIPETLPFVGQLSARFTLHRIRRVNVSLGASAADLLKLVRAVTGDDTAVMDGALKDFTTIGVEMIRLKPEILQAGRRPAAVSSAFNRAEVLGTEEAEEPVGTVEVDPDKTIEIETVARTGIEVDPDKTVEIETVDADKTVEIQTVDVDRTVEIQTPDADKTVEIQSADRDKTVEIETVGIQDGAGGAGAPTQGDGVDLEDGAERRLSMALLKLTAASAEDDLDDLVDTVVLGVEAGLEEGDDSTALEGMASLVNLEAQAPLAEKEIYTRALLRVLLPETLVRIARLVAQSKQARYAVTVLHRSGVPGTDALLEQLVKAPSVEEMDAYGAALPAARDGVEKLLALLESSDPATVVVAIGQLSKLNVVEAAGEIAGVAIHHGELEVKQAACRGLLGLEETEVVLEHIASVLETDSGIHLGRSIEGEVSDKLGLLLVAAAAATTNVVAKKALCRALGRIATPTATRQLIRMSMPGGRFFGRKPVDGRLAAIEGLGMLEGPAARGTLEELIRDRNAAIRAAAKAALESRGPEAAT